MTVFELLTAIADKIRSLLGLSGKMSLEAISTNLSTEQENVASAFNMVTERGGTVPDELISGNLANAINTIPTGVTVQRKSGSFTTSSIGKATVNCGFQPDVVYVRGETQSADNGTFDYSMAICFNEESRSNQLNTLMWYSGGMVDATWVKSSTGFTVTVYLYDWEFSSSVASRKTYSYIAVKYTE